MLGYRIEEVEHPALWGHDRHWQAVTFEGKVLRNRVTRRSIFATRELAVALRSLSSWCAHARRWRARLDGVTAPVSYGVASCMNTQTKKGSRFQGAGPDNVSAHQCWLGTVANGSRPLFPPSALRLRRIGGAG